MLQVLVNAQGAIGETNTASSSFGLSVVRNAMVEWSLNLGENIMQIVMGKFSGSENSSVSSDKKISEHILVLCEHSIFLLKVTRIQSG